MVNPAGNSSSTSGRSRWVSVRLKCDSVTVVLRTMNLCVQIGRWDSCSLQKSHCSLFFTWEKWQWRTRNCPFTRQWTEEHNLYANYGTCTAMQSMVIRAVISYIIYSMYDEANNLLRCRYRDRVRGGIIRGANRATDGYSRQFSNSKIAYIYGHGWVAILRPLQTRA